MLISMVLLAFTLSIDALGIGIAYTIRGVYITNPAKLIIGVVSIVVMRISALFGAYLHHLFPGKVTVYFGAAILIFMGIIFIVKSFNTSDDIPYDLDHSSSIEGKEAILLGIALSADSISAGIAIASLGISGLGISLMVGVLQYSFLVLGKVLVTKVKRIKTLNGKMCSILSGIIFIGIAVARLISS